jgi:hypothetical protein
LASTPESDGKPYQDWLFRASQVPDHYWKDINNRLKFLEWAAKQLQVEKLEDWYQHSKRDLYPLGGSFAVHRIFCGPNMLWRT